jgi:pimeloyl-ACP methyl ester carboxylesterase
VAPTLAQLEQQVLPADIRSRIIDNHNGLRMRVLEAGAANNPCVLLLHGFPELAFSWRKVMLPLANAGFHVVAPDQRGYGMTTGADNRYDGDVGSFRQFNLARDVLGLVHALGRDHVHAVVGHDFGSPVAATCAVIRPDVFRRVALMSAPFAGMPTLPTASTPCSVAGIDHQALADLPRPRKHYQWYYSQADAEHNMLHCRQGLHDFLRAYYHYKSADWTENRPYALADWSAQSFAQLPTYYVMDNEAGMAETVEPFMPSIDRIANCGWLPDTELAVYTASFSQTGLQGGLNWYRCVTSGDYISEMQMFSGLSIGVPSMFIAGTSDWGIHQKPGEFERMQSRACSDMRHVELIDGAGHWVQQEQPEAVVQALLAHLL